MDLARHAVTLLKDGEIARLSEESLLRLLPLGYVPHQREEVAPSSQLNEADMSFGEEHGAVCTPELRLLEVEMPVLRRDIQVTAHRLGVLTVETRVDAVQLHTDQFITIEAQITAGACVDVDEPEVAVEDDYGVGALFDQTPVALLAFSGA